MSQLPIKLTIPANSSYLDIVRGALYAIASKTGFSYEDIEDMKVAVTEACTNAMLHAYRGEEDGWIELSFQWDEREFSITVRDGGSSFDHKEERQPLSALRDTPIAKVSVGGLGLFMMQALMDEVHVRTDKGTEVVLIKRLARNEESV